MPSHSFWYTDTNVIKKIYEVFNYITIDPTTSPEANKRVRAEFVYTIDDSCLTTPKWLPDAPDGAVTCYMNPPYSKDCDGTKPYVVKLLEQLDKGVVNAAIVLVNSSTSSSWFQLLMKNSELVCFPSKRLCFDEDLDYVKKYVDPEEPGHGLKTGKAPRYDNAVFLLISDSSYSHYAENFIDSFSSMGSVLKLV